ncbi:MAG: hypothetical protein V3V08_23385 [Nannocystaceae bacterium]
MRIYVCTDFTGHYPVGVSAVIVAESEGEAVNVLESELIRIGLEQSDPVTVVELDTAVSSAHILCDGNY